MRLHFLTQIMLWASQTQPVSSLQLLVSLFLSEQPGLHNESTHSHTELERHASTDDDLEHVP